MFLDKTIERNGRLVRWAFDAHRLGLVQPDSFIVDVDAFKRNAKAILDEATRHSMKLFFMLKQIGRNPYLARLLQNMGYDGAVVVDFREAEVMMANSIRIGNVGHLVQIPDSMIARIVGYGVDNITVYSLEKARRIDEEAGRLGKKQDILIRVYSDEDMIYSGQTAGFDLNCLESVMESLSSFKNIRIAGVTSFPCFLYDGREGDIMPTRNLETVLKAVGILETAGYGDLLVNTPSTTSVRTIGKMVRYGGNCGEPGHGLSGTTPLHAVSDQPEIPAVVYLSEVSHCFQERAYAFGGGHYRRSHVRSALVGKSFDGASRLEVIPPSDESIDYHFGLSGEAAVGDGVVMAFRFQTFVTRSDVVLVEGFDDGEARIVGVYDSLGRSRV